MSGNFYDIIIIGAGASGLMAAVGAGQAGTSSDSPGNGKKILVLEKMPKAGRKIMITGKGRCNFTNMKQWEDFLGHVHPKADFLKPAFYNLTPENTVGFFNRLGVETTVERGDRVFPSSGKSSAIVDALMKAAAGAGAVIMFGKEVHDVRKDCKGKYEIVCGNGGTFRCSRLIICTGGLSYPSTGSTGDGYKWARQFSHTVKNCFPSLTAIVPKGYKASSKVKNNESAVETAGMPTPRMKGHVDRSIPLAETGRLLCGNQLKNVSITVKTDGNTVQEEFGDIDFTDGGLEGALGFKVSRRCVNAISNGSKVSVSIDLKPAVALDRLKRRIDSLWEEIENDRRNRTAPFKNKFKILLGKLMPYRMIPAFIRIFPDASPENLAGLLKNMEMDIEGYVGYERCVITAGGISLSELKPKTMESKLSEGLYFAGEIIDLDADTGGYNLQTAFSTGYLAGMSAAKCGDGIK